MQPASRPTAPQRSARQRLGALVSAARVRRGWTKKRLAEAAGVSCSLVGTIEAGAPGASLDSIEQVARALGGEVRVDLIVPVEPAGRARQADPVHATCIAHLGRLGRRHLLLTATEVEIVDGNARGWVDLLLFDPRNGRLIVIEFKTEYRDHGALERQVGFYARGAAAAARARGWPVKEIAVVVVMLQSDAVETAVAANRAALKSAFPMRGQTAVRAILDGGPVMGRGLLCFNPLATGRRALTSFVVDGRRTPAAVHDYADAAERLRMRSAR